MYNIYLDIASCLNKYIGSTGRRRVEAGGGVDLVARPRREAGARYASYYDKFKITW